MSLFESVPKMNVCSDQASTYHTDIIKTNMIVRMIVHIISNKLLHYTFMRE